MTSKAYGATLLALFLAYSGATLATPRVSVTHSPGMVSEGEKMTFNFELSKPTPAAGLQVRLAMYRDSDPQLGDVDYFVDGSHNVTDVELAKDAEGRFTDLLVTLAGNVKSAQLVSLVVDDGIAEPEERTEFALAYQGSSYIIDPIRNKIDYTLTDYPVVSIVNALAEAREGGQVPIFFKLSKPAPAGGLRVRLAVLRNSDPAPGDLAYLTEGSSHITGYETDRGLDNQLNNLYVTIEEGATEASFYSDVVVDDEREGPESLLFSLAVSGDYSISERHNTVLFQFFDKR
jgi:hypothetical protein